MFKVGDNVEYVSNTPSSDRELDGRHGVVTARCFHEWDVDVRLDGRRDTVTYAAQNIRRLHDGYTGPARPTRTTEYGGPVLPSPAPKNPNPKDSIGSSKLPLHLWPASATAYGSLALLDGALKYGRSNYRGTPVRASIYVDAAMRHMQKWMEGRNNDIDSGLPELAHALACIGILIDAETHGSLIDDRMYVPAGSEGFLGLMDKLTPHVTRLQALHADKNPQHFTKETNAI